MVWVITGASSGIGRRTALDVARSGATVCIAARREERLRTLIDELGGAGSKHSFFPTDVSDRAQVAALAEHVADTHGRCDVLVNNAGASGPPSFRGAESVAEIEQLMATNFFGAVYCMAEFMDLLVRSAPAHVVNVTSMAGRLAAGAMAAYSASKFALVGWSEAVQPELARKEIFVSSVEPGFIPTEGFPQADMVDDPIMKHLLGTDEDVSKAIQDAVAGRKQQRVVPRWYYLLQLPRVLAPPVYRFVATRLSASRRPAE